MTTGRLTEDEYLCPSCFSGEHDCQDLFNLPPFGTLACSCTKPVCVAKTKDGDNG